MEHVCRAVSQEYTLLPSWKLKIHLRRSLLSEPQNSKQNWIGSRNPSKCDLKDKLQSVFWLFTTLLHTHFRLKKSKEKNILSRLTAYKDKIESKIMEKESATT